MQPKREPACPGPLALVVRVEVGAASRVSEVDDCKGDDERDEYEGGDDELGERVSECN